VTVGDARKIKKPLSWFREAPPLSLVKEEVYRAFLLQLKVLPDTLFYHFD